MDVSSWFNTQQNATVDFVSDAYKTYVSLSTYFIFWIMKGGGKYWIFIFIRYRKSHTVMSCQSRMGPILMPLWWSITEGKINDWRLNDIKPCTCFSLSISNTSWYARVYTSFTRINVTGRKYLYAVRHLTFNFEVWTFTRRNTHVFIVYARWRTYLYAVMLWLRPLFSIVMRLSSIQYRCYVNFGASSSCNATSTSRFTPYHRTPCVM